MAIPSPVIENTYSLFLKFCFLSSVSSVLFHCSWWWTNGRERRDKKKMRLVAERSWSLMVGFLFQALATEISGVQDWCFQVSFPTQPIPPPQPLLQSGGGWPDLLFSRFPAVRQCLDLCFSAGSLAPAFVLFVSVSPWWAALSRDVPGAV